MSKGRTNKFIDTIDECLTNGANNGIFQVSLEDDSLNGRQVTIGGRSVVNFGSCSYLGLEVDERLKQGAIEATQRFGTQYSSSRLFSECNLYEELEGLFYQIFDNNPSLLAATTTLTHLGALPILVQDDDLIILDHQVHGSVQLAVQLVKARGTKVDMIKHNRMDMLEDLVKENPNKYNKIWYMADGLYSMYGDYTPVHDLIALMEKYGNFHVYIDDAHGMSWTGKNGSGYIMSQTSLHPKMVLTTSLAKGFGTGGGVTIVSDKEMKRKIKTCGSSYTFSGPIQPPMLGASIASAKIHLSDEIYTLQNELKEKTELTREIIDKHDLPLVIPSGSPIFYLGLGLPRVGYNMVKRLLSEGFYTNIGIFPGVPVKCCGLRLAITNGQTKEDIRNVLDAYAYHFPKVLEEEGQSVEDISNNFDLPFTPTRKRYAVESDKMDESPFEVQHETTIHHIDKQLWDDLLGDNGTFDWEGCRFIEETFTDNPEPENNWNLHYLIIRDKETSKPVLATYFTEMLCKDDMVAPASASKRIEELRALDKYYLSSKVIMMGSLLSLGEHLYLDKTYGQWRRAVIEMISIMDQVKTDVNASMIQLREFDKDDVDINDFLIAEGFVKVEMPDMHTLENMQWDSVDKYLSSFSSGSRWHFKKKILSKSKYFDVKTLDDRQSKKMGDIDKWYELYSNVKNKSFNINTYAIPRKFMKKIAEHPNWEVIELRIKPEFSLNGTNDLVSVNFCHKSAKNNYTLFAVGMDYDYVIDHGCYRQGMFQSVLRANHLGAHKVYLGMDASVEKRRFGVRVIPKNAYIQADDNFNFEIIGSIHNIHQE